jgi:nitrate reductase alpha subunit
MKDKETFSNGHGIVTDEDRNWEDAYRHRWQHDKVVRSTHGVNCTGGCSWKIFVKNGLVSFEMQQTDYPRTREDLPNHEPRGCQRGASFSWYLYSPHRIKHPLIRGRLLELYRAERKAGKDPVEAWAAIQPIRPSASIRRAARRLRAHPLGRMTETSLPPTHTIKNGTGSHLRLAHPDVEISRGRFALHSRRRCLRFVHDWHCDCPLRRHRPGEQTDAGSGRLVQPTYVSPAQLPMTRTPDAHFRGRHKAPGSMSPTMPSM